MSGLGAFEIILLLTVAGSVLLAIELFVPGMILGILGGLALVSAVIFAYWEYGLAGGSFMLLVVVALSIVIFLAWLNLFPRSPVGRRLMLTASVKGKTEHPDYTGLEGKSGKSITQLRPAGTANIDGHRVDVVAESDFIDAGEPLSVIRVEGVRVVVRRA